MKYLNLKYNNYFEIYNMDSQSEEDKLPEALQPLGKEELLGLRAD